MVAINILIFWLLKTSAELVLLHMRVSTTSTIAMSQGEDARRRQQTAKKEGGPACRKDGLEGERPDSRHEGCQGWLALAGIRRPKGI
jgi:hypothetical protein